MFKNNLKIAWRNILKQKLYSFINIGGLSVGIAACLLIALYIKDELSFDKFVSDNQQIFRLYMNYKYGGKTESAVWFQAPFAKALLNDYPEIEEAGRFLNSELFGAGPNHIRRADRIENAYEERFAYFDPSLLHILDVKMVYGDRRQALAQPNSLVMSRSKAEKYFPGENPVGKTMLLNDNKTTPLTIGGVMEDFPANSHIQFDFLITMAGREFWPGEQNSWQATNYHTYVKLKKGTDVRQLESRLSAMLEKYLLPDFKNAGNVRALQIVKQSTFGFQPITDINLHSGQIQDGLSHGDIRFVWLFGAVAGFILLIACINFVNLSTARSANRAIEVGVRKVVGSKRSGLILQFLTESVLLSVISFILGFLTAAVALPLFNGLASKSIVFPAGEWWLWGAMVVGALLLGIAAGLYPAFYLSGFQPVGVLKGALSRGTKSSGLRSALVVVQFTTSIVLIIGTFVIYRQMNYILNKKLGFDKEQVVLLHGANTMGDHVVAFCDELKKMPQVRSVAVSDYLPVKGTKRNGNPFWNKGKTQVDESVSGQLWVVDEGYVPTLGLKLTEGRNFSKDRGNEDNAIIINEEMAKKLNLKNPIGKHITNNSDDAADFEIIGVVKNFHFESLREEIGPLALKYGSSSSIVAVKIAPDNSARTVAAITDLWKGFSPNQPVRYTFLSQNFERMYRDVLRVGGIFTSFALLAVLVACLGLFALSAFMVEQRGKEISIRKVLGASIQSILGLLTKNFLMLVLISVLIASLVAYYFMKKWLQDFQYHTEIGWQVFALAGVISISIALLTISFQAIKAALQNPVDRLKAE